MNKVKVLKQNIARSEVTIIFMNEDILVWYHEKTEIFFIGNEGIFSNKEDFSKN